MAARDLPRVSDLVEPNTRAPLSRVIEEVQRLLGFRGETLDRAITERRAIDLGLIDEALRPLGGGGAGSPGPPGPPGPPGSGVTPPDLTPPPTATGLAVDGGFSNVIVRWNAATYTTGHGPGQTNIYAVKRDLAALGTLPVFGDANRVATVYGAGNITALPSELNTRWYVWIKFQSVDGVESTAPAGGTNGVQADTGQDVTQLLQILTGEITESQLYAALGARINLIDGPDSLAGSVAARILAEATARGAAITSEATTRSTADSALASSITTLTASVGSNAAAITAEASARVSGDAAQATALSAVAARLNSRPNLLPNGGFANGKTGWGGSLISAFNIEDGVWGRTLVSTSFASGTGALESDFFPVAASEWYTVHGDALFFASGGTVYFDLLFYDASNTLLGDGGQNPLPPSFDFSNDDTRRAAMAVEHQSPSGAAKAKARFVVQSATACTAVGCRLIKVERGRLPHSAYTTENDSVSGFAAVAQETSARVSADGALASSITSLTSTVTTNQATLSAAITAEATTRATQDTALSSSITTLSATVGSNSAAIAAESSARASLDGSVSALYTVRAEISAAGRTMVGGFGLSATSTASGGPRIDFGVRADRFWVSAPSTATGVPDIVPFTILTTSAVEDGVTIPAGIYMDAAYIRNLSALVARIGVATIDDAKIANLSAAKLTIGDGAVGGNLKSTSFAAGSGSTPGTGWLLTPAGALHASGATIYGTIYATAGVFAGSLSAATGTFGGNVTGLVAGTSAATLLGTANTAAADASSALSNAAAAQSTANTGVSNAATAQSTANSKLNKSAADVLTGTINLAVSQALYVGTVNDGVYFGSTGIVGRKAGANTFVIAADGTATFAGALSAATGSFTGTLTVGSSPAVSGTTMTGVGLTVAPSAVGAWGNSTTNLTFDGSAMKMNGAWITAANLSLGSFTTSISGTSTKTGALAAGNHVIGTLTAATPTGGTAPFTYLWSIVPLGNDNNNNDYLYLTGTMTNTGVGLSGILANTSPQSVAASISCVVTDAQGRTTTAGRTGILTRT